MPCWVSSWKDWHRQIQLKICVSLLWNLDSNTEVPEPVADVSSAIQERKHAVDLSPPREAVIVIHHDQNSEPVCETSERSRPNWENTFTTHLRFIVDPAQPSCPSQPVTISKICDVTDDAFERVIQVPKPKTRLQIKQEQKNIFKIGKQILSQDSRVLISSSIFVQLNSTTFCVTRRKSLCCILSTYFGFYNLLTFDSRNEIDQIMKFHTHEEYSSEWAIVKQWFERSTHQITASRTEIPDLNIFTLTFRFLVLAAHQWRERWMVCSFNTIEPMNESISIDYLGLMYPEEVVNWKCQTAACQSQWNSWRRWNISEMEILVQCVNWDWMEQPRLE